MSAMPGRYRPAYMLHAVLLEIVIGVKVREMLVVEPVCEVVVSVTEVFVVVEPE